MYTWSQGRSTKAKSVDRALSCILGVTKRVVFWGFKCILGVTMGYRATSLSCGLPWWSLASTPWAMSLYFKFRAIYFWLLNEYEWWHQAKIYHIIRHLSYRCSARVDYWIHVRLWDVNTQPFTNFNYRLAKSSLSLHSIEMRSKSLCTA